MKNYFTKQQIEQLKVFEQHFYTAVYENYKRASAASDNDKIADLYEKTTGNKVNRNWSCGTCVLNCYKAVGALYFESKKHLENEPEEKNLSEGAKHSEAQEPVSGTEGTEGVGVNDTKSKVLETVQAVEKEPEPAPVKATSTKKVANKDKKKTKRTTNQ